MNILRNVALVLVLICCVACKAQSNESRIIKNTTVNWTDYDKLFMDADNTPFKDVFANLSKIEMHELTYISDGLEIQAFYAKPKTDDGHKKWPVIVFNRGGNRDFGALSLFKSGDFTYPTAFGFSKLASSGFLVIGCNYRGGGLSQGKDEFGGSDVNDIINLVEALNEIEGADTSRIGLYGWSRGSMMTLLALTKLNNIEAAVVGAGHYDLTVIDRPEMEQHVYAELIPNYWENKTSELKKRSAVFFADQLPKNTPLLLLHGNSDWRVKSTHSLNLALQLEKYRVPYRLKIFEGGNHGLTKFKEEIDNDVLNWFSTYLKNDAPLPNMEFHGN